ncbi:helix-turn-helix domain-containing protein, partial [Patescibacteria group bacterium AH-259-L07]|nr:helix-turn-helix domain-containing protein [Patescibacteria group bacterium AH-259-L07]
RITDIVILLLRYHMSSISKNVKKLREARGLTQEKLARLADVANNTIVKIEAGKNQNPTLETLKKITSVLGISIDDLTR